MTQSKVIKPRNHKLSSGDVKECQHVLEHGGIIILPTDTVYGIACNAFNIEAIRRVYEIKGRDYTKSLPVLLSSSMQLDLVAKDIPKEAGQLIDAFWPGPLTLVFNASHHALAATRGKETIAVRVPDHGVIKQILDATGLPLAATSANKSNRPALASGGQVRHEFNGQVDMIIDDGPCKTGEASSVIDATHFPFTLLREGAVSKIQLLNTMGLGY